MVGPVLGFQVSCPDQKFVFKRSPFKDAEVNPEPPQLDFQDRVRLTIAFLHFYHRTIIASLLVIGLGYWIYRATTAQPAPIAQPILEQPVPEELPSTSLEFASAPQNQNPDDSTSRHSGPASTDSGTTGKVAESLSAAELIKQSLDLRERIGSGTPIVNFMRCSERAKLSRRLMEMDLSSTQQVFALVSYIESISMVDSLNVQGKLNIDGPRAALLEIDEKYSDHPDPNVRCKANLAMVLQPAYDYLTLEDPRLIEKFKQAFDQRVAIIAGDLRASRQLLKTVLMIHNKSGAESDAWPVTRHVLKSYEKIPSPAVQQMVAGFKEQLFFGDLDLNTLLDRMEADDSKVRKDTEGLFDALDGNPGTRLEIYLIAVAVIKKARELEQVDRAESLLVSLQESVAKITDEKHREAVLQALGALE